jgi:septum formation protein
VLILASRSPQRRAILERLGVAFEVVVSDAPELAIGDPIEVASENALRKARVVHQARGGGAGVVVLGADTIVAFDGRLFGKPTDEDHARHMLATLSGQSHLVVGAITLISAAGERTVSATTRVRFRTIDARMLDWYIATGEWRERAGAYAIQGAGTALVRELDGEYENVVGLPLAKLLDIDPELLHR